MTNLSGKFITKVSYATSDSSVDTDVSAQKFIPPVPTPPAMAVTGTGSGYMDTIKDNFGKLWWLWLVVAFFWLTKGE